MTLWKRRKFSCSNGYECKGGKGKMYISAVVKSPFRLERENIEENGSILTRRKLVFLGKEKEKHFRFFVSLLLRLKAWKFSLFRDRFRGKKNFFFHFRLPKIFSFPELLFVVNFRYFSRFSYSFELWNMILSQFFSQQKFAKREINFSFFLPKHKPNKQQQTIREMYYVKLWKWRIQITMNSNKFRLTFLFLQMLSQNIFKYINVIQKIVVR